MQSIETKLYPERNITLDYFKLILAILVVAIHTPIVPSFYISNTFSNGISRIAVPCFFIINGFYFAYLKNDKKKVLSYLKKLIIIYITWTLIYGGFAIYWGDPIWKIIRGFYHLWYLPALIGATIMIYLTRKINLRTVLISAIVIYLSAWIVQRIFIEKTLLTVYGEDIFRNFFFDGFPLMFIGYYISLQQKNILTKIGKKALIVIILIGFILLFAEKTYLDARYFKHFYGDFYVSIIFMCPALFLLILKISKYKKSDGYISKLSSGIYFGHLLIIQIFVVISKDSFPMDYFFIVFVLLSMLLAMGIIKLNNYVKIFI